MNTGRVGNSILRRYTQAEQRPYGCVAEETQENQFYSDDDSRSDFGTMSEISHFTAQSRDVPVDDVEPDIQEMIDFKPLYKCLHIRSLLDQRIEFIRQYRLERHDQAHLLFRYGES